MAPDTSSPQLRPTNRRDSIANEATAHEALASPISRPLLATRFPDAQDWAAAPSISFCNDWQGNHSDPERSTEVRILWSSETLFLNFECRYREIWVFDDSDPSGRRDGLWDRDVAEAFLQPDDFGSRNYKELEVSPNGFWVDLQISEAPRRDLKSGLRCTARIDEIRRLWSAQLAIPMRSLTHNFDPEKSWRANFFRAEGKDPNRAYMAWQPTHTPQPQFHVPAAFGTLKFQK
jgi:alpha-galactosidase